MTAPNKTSIPRIRSVTFKNGGAKIYVLRPQVDEDRQHIEEMVRLVLDRHGDTGLAGFAFVVWSADGSSTNKAESHDGIIPTIMVPDFVRNILLADRIERWTAHTYGLEVIDG